MVSSPSLYKFSFGKIKAEFDESEALSGPNGRSGHRIIACDKNIYVYGGFNPNIVDVEMMPEAAMLIGTTLFLEIWCFNLLRKEWKKICSWATPTEVASTTVKKMGNMMVIHGGTGVPFGRINSSSTYVKHLLHGNLKKLDATGDIPAGRYGQASVMDEKNKLFYVVGGTSGYNFSLDVHCFDLKNNKWTKLSRDIPENISPRYRHEIALYNSKIYVFGGGTLYEVYGFKLIPVFDLITKKWSVINSKGFFETDDTIPMYPPPRRCHSGVMVPEDEYNDASFIICGGLAINRSFSDVWSLNLRTEQWSKWATTLPFKLYFHDAVLTPHGQMIVFGGVIASYEWDVIQFRTNAVFSCWAKLPKLSEMAWEALRSYHPELLKLGSKELRRLGIPLSFANRINM